MSNNGKEKATRTPVSQSDDARNRRREARRKMQAFETADWSGVDPGTLRLLVANITQHGFAVMLGYTRDKGVYTVRIIGDDEAPTEYIRPSEDVNLIIAGIADLYGK